jgi:hypothetical protein
MPNVYRSDDGKFHRTQKEAGPCPATLFVPTKHKDLVAFLNKMREEDKAQASAPTAPTPAPKQPAKQRRADYVKRGALHRAIQFGEILAGLKIEFGPNATQSDQHFIDALGYKSGTSLIFQRGVEEGWFEPRPFHKASWVSYPLMFTPEGWRKFVSPKLQK